MSDRIDLAAIRTRLAAATPGPVCPDCGGTESVLGSDDATPFCAECTGEMAWPSETIDSAAMSALCDEVERLRASNERLRHVVELDEAIYMDLARSAGFGHENAEHGARQCIAAVQALAAERDALREILAGRTTAPTPEEVIAHARSGGMWVEDYERSEVRGRCVIAPKNSVSGDSTYYRWWALDASGAPCAWPKAAQ